MGSLLKLQPKRPDRALHGYVYYRWTDRYMAIVRYFLTRRRLLPRVRAAAGKRLARGHHAKVVPTSQARRVLVIDRPIEWRDLDRVVPFELARDIVLEAPPAIALARCACRAVAERKGERRNHSCGPLEQCLYMGEPIASFVIAHQPSSARSISVDEAVAVVEAAASRGHVHTLWFKDAAGGRMYAICNCCRECCIGLAAHREGFRPLAPSGLCATVDLARCDGCGACVGACPFSVIALGAKDGKAVVAGSCYGCGVCSSICTRGALTLGSGTGGVAQLPL